MANISIKELFPADSLINAVEKINFNFDQVILGGGGPQGEIGETGNAGGQGPIGDRGNYWFAGSTYGGITGDYGRYTLKTSGDHDALFEFTNNDGKDDYFVITHPIDSKVRLAVFNRWGNPIFTSDEYDNKWDGRGVKSALGDYVVPGTYYYVVTVMFANGESKKFAGPLTIVR
jgi:gliding motility-associated-like protein